MTDTGQPTHPQFLSRRRSYLGSIKKDLKDLQGGRALMGELTQNADDAGGARTIRFEVTPDAFVVSNDGEFTKCDDVTTEVCEWLSRTHRCDFHSFREVASGDKEGRERTTGAFGIGFTSVYQVTDGPQLFSNGEHWVLDETADEGNRIDRKSGVVTDGTTFVLPWAREESLMRREIAQPVVTDERIAELTDELLAVAPELLLFSRRLKNLQVAARGESKSFRRLEDGDVVTIESTHGETRRWLMLQSDLGEVALRLIREHSTLIQPSRPTEVQVAIELDANPTRGSYFVTLPTEQPTELPLSVNGAFFPKPDRKRIRLGDGHAESLWNEAILECAAILVARSLATLVSQIDDHWVVRLLRGAHALSTRSAGAEAHAQQAWWKHLGSVLQQTAIVPTVTGLHGTTMQVWLTNDDSVEAPAALVLAKLGVHLIDTAVRNEWYQLNNDAKISLRQLRLHSVTNALEVQQRGVASPWLGDRLSVEEREVFWSLTNHLASAALSSHESRGAAANLPIAPLRDGSIVALELAINAQPGERDLLVESGLAAPLLDEQFASQYRELAALTPTLSVSQMALLTREAFTEGTVPETFDRARLLDWFARRTTEAVPLGRAWFDTLPIFPTGDGYRTSTDLKLPVEGFNPPERAGNLLLLQNRPAEVRPFLVALGVPALDLAHFCTDLLPEISDRGLSTGELNELVTFLARHVSQIKENDAVRRALSDLPLVPCTDGVPRTGREVYFGTVSPLLVGDRPVATPLGGQTVRDLFEWLGVSERARARHVVEHCLTFRSPPPRHVDAVSAVLRHLQNVDRKHLDPSYSQLQREPWLPAAGRVGAAKPDELFTTFQRYLFSSQGQFLDVPPDVQRSTNDALRWLGVLTEPPTELVVEHLLHSSAEGAAVNGEVYTFLNRHSEEPIIGRLRGNRSILLEGSGYVRPSHCFWDSNPFDRHRVLLSPEFRTLQPLFDRIGVRPVPDADDVVDVLGEIASAHGGAKQALLEQDIPIVQSCWVLLDELVRNGSVTEQQLDELRRTECVLDSSQWLRRPPEVLYRDSSQIARQLSPATAARLIARPDNMKAALDAVGVRHLRQAIRTQVVEREDRPDPSEFKEHVDLRRMALARVLDGLVAAPFALLDQFRDHADVRALDRLVVIERLDLEGAPDDPSPSDRAALWDDERHELLIVDDSTRWPEIAREFAIALGIEGEDVAHAATPFLNILRAQSAGDASAELDVLGYRDLDEGVDPGLDAFESSPPVSAEETPDDAVTEPASTDEELEQRVHALPGVDSSAAKTERHETDEQPPGETAAVSAPGSTPENDQDLPRSTPATESLGLVSGGGETTSASTVSPSPRRSSAASPSVRQQIQRPKSRQRLISYVAAGGVETEDADPETLGRRSAIDDSAITAVLAFERSMGREPEPMDHSNPGFDIKSVEPDGSIRYIEVKGTAGAWDSLGVGITSRQYQEARDLAEQFWLYVVVVTKDGPSEPFRIQDPASQIDRYYFDEGWRSAAEQSVAVSAALPDITMVSDPAELEAPVRLVSYLDGSDTGLWVPCPSECLGDIDAGLFAVRIAGQTLDLLHRGGVAFAVPTGDVSDRDPVVVRLLNRVDPETDGVLSVRYFGEERSVAGELVSARLETNTGLPPISIDDLSTIEILGRVVHKELPA